MADAKTTALTAATSWASGDLLYMVSNPGGTPASRKITLDNVLSKIVCAANAKAIGVTGYSLTGSDATSMIDLAGTWNTSGTPTLIKANVTDTASAAASLLMDLQVGGISQLSVSKAGGLTSAITDTARVIQWNGNNNYIGSNSNTLYLKSYAGDLSVSGSLVYTTLPIALGGVIGRNAYLVGEAADTLALRNGANAQCLNVYGTWTSTSVYERAFMRYSVANTRYEIGTEHTGAAARDLEVMVPTAKIVGMDKTTEDNGFINFKATADADATSAISTLTTSGTVTHHIQVKINGVKAWIPCSTTNPS